MRWSASGAGVGALSCVCAVGSGLERYGADVMREEGLWCVGGMEEDESSVESAARRWGRFSFENGGNDRRDGDGKKEVNK